MGLQANRYTVPECAGCARARPDKGRYICIGIKEPGYFWAKYGSCPGYTADGSTDGMENLAPKGRRAAAGAGKGAGT